ncbi:copper chaperone PCu(A)C [Tropicimonas sp. TH_r6]|uniref:copper chaperone PCu(A)C n=1 Tax=Tropicimonas sp. TH_r6 TaxID=3082085 RepID=UPI0029537B82|nr:copper chaperone PCu(A)C [Tropicimonas sp. TH_r6]MDV7142106.1 copper chaperone PCu(A)C [Tropicimonas sp. TH_r6]
MSPKILFAAAAALSLAAPAMAEIEIRDAYARAAMPTAKAGAAFMQIVNTGTEDDRLVAVASGIAKKAELHTHIDAGDGIMQMVEVEEGFPVPAGGMHMLKRGGDHVMFMGLTGPMNDGESFSVTFTFEKAGEMVVEIPVDLKRQDAEMKMDHSSH